MNGLRKFYTFDEMKIFAVQNGLDPNTMLWVGDKSHDKIRSVFRQGKKPDVKSGQGKPEMFLSWDDIGKDSPDGEKFITEKYFKISFKFPHGISLFLQPNLQDGEELSEHLPPKDEAGNPNTINPMLKRAKTDFSPRYERHFYEMPLKGTLPHGLVLVYDGGINDLPQGHVTLTVQKPMMVGEFNELVQKDLIAKFEYIGPAVTGKRRSHK